MATIPTAAVRIRLYPMVRRKISPSEPTRLTPAAPTERFCGLIILPITPPDELMPADHDLLGGERLHRAEERVGCGVAPGQKDAQRADDRGEEGKDGAGFCH